MKNKFLLLAGTVLVLTLGSCVINYDTDDPSDEDATYSISGTVGVSDQSEKHLPAGTRVELRQGGRPIRFVETAVGANGVYTLDGVEPGTYTLEMAKDGYLTGTISGVEVTNADVTGKDITLKKAAVPIVSYTVSGTISTSDGGSAAGADVVLMDGRNPKASITAGAAGAYTLAGVTAGTYTIEAYLDGYTIGTLSGVTVSSGNLAGKDITLTRDTAPTYSVHGTVSLSDGESPEGVHVQLRQGGQEVQSTPAGASGAYTFTGVAPGTYTIQVSFAGYTTGTISGVTVGSGNVTVDDIDLEKKAAAPASGTYTVSGTISVSDSASGGSPQGAYVQLQKDGVAVGSPGAAGANGLYSISGVEAGTYTIEASLDGYTPGVSASFTVSGNVSGQNLTLTKIAATEVTYTVSGTISLSDGKPGAEARVRLLKDGEYVHATSVGADADGYYSISNVVAGGGPYTIGARLDGYEINQTPEFTVSGHVSGKNLTLQKSAAPTYSISGTISVSDSANGGSPAGADVQLRQDGQAVGSVAHAGDTGAYTLSGVEAGTYAIEVNHTGYDMYTLSPVTVAGANVTGQNISLTKTVIAVTGVSLSQTTLTLTSGETATLTAIITPSNATNKHVTWTSDTPAVASVSGGVVTAASAGTATITVTTENGGKTASCAVTVSAAAAAGPVEITGKTITEALDWIKNSGADNGNYLIKLGADESNVANYDISGFPTGLTITVDGGGHTVQWASGSSTTQGCLTLSQNVTFILKNVTFQGVIGNTGKTEPLVWVKGNSTFKMQNGAVLTGNQGGKFGSAVYVANKGNFVMEDGEITNNTIDSNTSSGVYSGVYLVNGAFMTMTGGSITGNKTAKYEDNDVSVFANGTGFGTLTMSGGAQIGRIWLKYQNDTKFGIININDSFTGSATIDLSSESLSGKQILQGDAVSSSYGQFTLGKLRSVAIGDGTALTGSIDSSGVWTK